ncbi:MAG: site-specific DNA-methyltransferase [Ignavibacteriae bacterium]|nr:site-specific DNA-methyltransferase [Ignavibacteriota bacterium]MCB9218614.1 site-specific DNA-methyltransferase [Ignavibacteriales bacterium]MCB9259380.1 site-specific DNA-methyltransferase [Ignavibacteriales bacterium]
MNKTYKSNNRTIRLKEEEISELSKNLVKLNGNCKKSDFHNKIINQDTFAVLDYLPNKFIDLLFIDPPYNMSKTFNSNKFSKLSIDDYGYWLDTVIQKMVRMLKPQASIYVCGDWHSSTSIHIVLNKYFKVRNRITWEREKGRGAKLNWKNSSEDIWFCTLSDKYCYNVDEVKLKRRVLAPYKENGSPKDWESNNNGSFRLTHPSNLWTDITVPFWSMPENTDHPTQKPEKLIAKIILASSNKGDFIFDPFLGSGTTAVVAKKLSRNFSGIEIDEKFASLAQKRLNLSEKDKSIQGYNDGVFWERNSLSYQNKK